MPTEEHKEGSEAMSLADELGITEGGPEEIELSRLHEALRVVNEQLNGGVTGIHLIAQKEYLEKLLELYKEYCREDDPEQKTILFNEYRDLVHGVHFLQSQQIDQVLNKKIRAASLKSTTVPGNDTVH